MSEFVDSWMAAFRAARPDATEASVAKVLAAITDWEAARKAAETAQAEFVAARESAARDLEALRVELGADTNPTPGPTPLIPDGANLVRVAPAGSFVLAAVNPTSATNPVGAPYGGCRGPNQMVAYQLAGRPVGVRTGTNAYGVEVEVGPDRVVRSVVVGQDGGILLPTDGYVLSGHGLAAAWLRTNCRAGTVVEVLHADTPAPGPTPGPTPTASGKTLAVYYMRGQGRVADIPGNVNQVRIAFAQGSPPSLVNWGGESDAAMVAGLAAFRARGGKVLISVGGSGGKVDTSNRGAFLQGILAIEKITTLDGIDWDVESGALNVADVVAISKALAEGRADTWLTSFVPPGGPPVALALQAAKACQDAGLKVQCGSQLYDAEVSLSAALGVLAQEVAVLGAPSVVVGMMIANDAKHWTVDQCEANMRAIVQRWPDIGGAYEWESARVGTAEWARRVGTVLGP